MSKKEKLPQTEPDSKGKPGAAGTPVGDVDPGIQPEEFRRFDRTQTKTRRCRNPGR